MMPKNNSLAIGLTVLFVVLMLTSLLARFWAVDLAWKKTGPTHLAATTEQVFLFAAGELIQLSADGELLQQFPSSITGLDDDPIDLRIMNDGRLLIAEQQPARIRLCNIVSWSCDEIGSGMYPHLHRQFKVLPHTPHHELLITDAAGDMLWGMSQDQYGPSPLVPARTLAGPNDLAMDRSGNLWIADTDHRRIIELKFLDDGELEPGREHFTQNHLTIGERYFPMMLAEAPDGLWWVVQAAEFSEGTADLVVYHPDEGANTLVELPGSTYPTDIAASGIFMLVTDLEQFRVYRIDTRRYEVSVFGDDGFKSLMSGLKERRERYLRISTLALAGVILFGVLMIVMAFKATPPGKRWTQAPSAIDFSKSGQSTPDIRGIHWLVRDARVDRSLKWAERLGFILPAGLMVSMLVVYGVALSLAGASPDDQVQEKLDDLGLVLVLGAFVMLCLIPLIRLGLRPLKAHLGSDGRRLCVRLFDGSEITVPPSELAYTNRVILHRQFTVPLQTGLNQKLYADGELEDWVLPLLREAEKISPAQAVRRMWQQRDDLLLWSVIAGVAMGLALILMSMVTN